ncbi:putative RNase III domain-containing protein [Seiridium cardinale]
MDLNAIMQHRMVMSRRLHRDIQRYILHSQEMLPFERLFSAKVALCGQILGHPITSTRSKTLFAEAINMTKAGYTTNVLLNGQRTIIPNNARLATYGDSVIQAHLCRLWLVQGPGAGESITSIGGILLTFGQVESKWHSVTELLTDENLIDVYHKSDLHRCTHHALGQDWLFRSKVVRSKPKATLVEAILGAVHLDAGAEALHLAMSRLGLTSHPHLRLPGSDDVVSDPMEYSPGPLYSVAKELLHSESRVVMNNYAERQWSNVQESNDLDSDPTESSLGSPDSTTEGTLHSESRVVMNNYAERQWPNVQESNDLDSDPTESSLGSTDSATEETLHSENRVVVVDEYSERHRTETVSSRVDSTHPIHARSKARKRKARKRRKRSQIKFRKLKLTKE